MFSLTVETANSYCKMTLRGVYDQIFGFNQRVLFNKEYYSIGDVAKLVGLNYRSIMVEKNKGRIKMAQSSTGRWYASKQDVIEWLNSSMIYLDDSHKERINFRNSFIEREAKTSSFVTEYELGSRINFRFDFLGILPDQSWIIINFCLVTMCIRISIKSI